MMALLFREHSYTWVVLTYLALGTLISLKVDPELMKSHAFWAFVVLTYFPFLFFDYLLTAIPIVAYGKNATLGLRVGTIPIEDFIYSLAMFMFYAALYRSVSRRIANQCGETTTATTPGV